MKCFNAELKSVPSQARDIVVSKNVRHKFVEDDEERWYDGFVISQIPGYPSWYNIVYDGDTETIYMYMGGVDKCDMSISLYRAHHKSRKWYKRLVWHFIDVCRVNAWTMFRALINSNCQLYQFKVAVAMSLIKGIANPRPVVWCNGVKDQPSTRNVLNSVRYDGYGHLTRQLAEVPKRCKFPGCSRRSKFMCVRCEVYLCVDKLTDCFYNYHTV